MACTVEWKRHSISVKREKEWRTRTCASALSQQDTSGIKLPMVSTGKSLSFVYYQWMADWSSWVEGKITRIRKGHFQREMRVSTIWTVIHKVDKELSATIRVTIHSFKFYWAGSWPSQHNKMVKAELLKGWEESAQRFNIAIQSGYRWKDVLKNKQPWLGAFVFRSMPWCVSWAQKS